MNKILIYVNNCPVFVFSGITVLQACEQIGISLPRFCYHDSLNIAGNCRICLVEIQNSPKPQVACGLPVTPNIRIYTNSPIVKKAREGVLEFLLLNHPLDCPICDQAGQCDLQNQARRFSSLRGRFFESKRGVTDKGFGPVIKTVITRCIHCTRCVRFISEIAGVSTLGTTLRGVNIQIGMYVKKPLESEISANIVDLCPVGALTVKPHAFKSRPWEISIVKGIDTIDSIGSHTSIEIKNFTPIKITPRPCLDINQEWITDTARFSYEGFINNRLAFSYYRKRNKFNKFISFNSIKIALKNYLLYQNRIQIVFGTNLDLEVLKQGLLLSKVIGWDFTEEHSYKLLPILPSFIQGISHFKDLNSIDFCLILGFNPRTEASLLNIRLRKAKRVNNIIATSLGSTEDLTFKTFQFGLNYNHLCKLALGQHNLNILRPKHPLLLFGDILAKRNDAQSSLLLSYIYQNVSIKNNLKSILRIPIGCNTISNAFLGISFPYSREILKSSLNYLVKIQNKTLLKLSPKGSIYENSHFVHTNKSYIKKFKFVLPLKTEYEKDSIFINCEGRLQKARGFRRFGFPAFAFTDSLDQVISHELIIFSSKSFKSKSFSSQASLNLQQLACTKRILKLYLTPLPSLFTNIYEQNQIAQSSVTLAKVNKNNRKHSWKFNDSFYSSVEKNNNITIN